MTIDESNINEYETFIREATPPLLVAAARMERFGYSFWAMYFRDLNARLQEECKYRVKAQEEKK